MPGGLAYALLGGDVVNQFPRKRIFGHAPMIGQIVQDVKPNVSKDIGTGWRHIGCMATTPTESKFNEALVNRVKRLRQERFSAAEDMALALDIPADRYRKYESRSPMPHYLIERFALIVGRDVEFILTGKLKPSRAPRPPATEKRAKQP
jgi:hypothetical protein